MGTTLTNGVYLPNEGERNCYAGLKTNWEILDQKVADVTALQQAVAGALHREIVESLPTTDIDPNTIYMVLSGTSATENVYNEFMYVNNAWELIGTSATDLTNYYTKAEVDGKLLLKANDSDVVHKSGNETVSGIKSFSDDTYITSLNFTNEVPSPSSSSSSIMPIITTITYGDSSPMVQARLNLRVTADGIKSLYPHENNVYSLGLNSRSFSDFYSYHGYFRGQQQNDEYSGNARTNLTLLANRDTLGASGVLFDTFRENTSQGTGSHILGIGMKENSIRYEGCRFSWFYDDKNSGYVFALRPTTQGNRPIKYELGNSGSKWSTINGVEPSALGMPDLANGIDISSYITTGDTDDNYYTPSVNGWIWAKMVGNGLAIQQGDFGSYANYVADSTTGDKYVETCLLVTKNVQATIRCRSITSIVSAKFYPCLGNV